MSLTGTLGIDLRIDDGNGVSVEFTPARQVDSGKLFSGKSWPEAAKLARLMFAVCGNGQAIAMALASQAAAGSKPNGAAMQARSMLLCAEALREHASRMLIDWPQLLDDAPRLDTMQQIVRAYAALQASLDFDRLLDGTFREMPALRDSARDLASIVREAIKAADFQMPDRLIARCAANPESETTRNDGTVLGRRNDDARLTGSGLERRIRARLIEVELLCDWLESPGRPCPLSMRAERTGDQSGASEVEVARGLLRHEIRLDGDIIVDCRICAPTSANFMPGGVADKAIRSLNSANTADFEWQARLAVLEVDPCVAHEVRVC